MADSDIIVDQQHLVTTNNFPFHNILIVNLLQKDTYILCIGVLSTSATEPTPVEGNVRFTAP